MIGDIALLIFPVTYNERESSGRTNFYTIETRLLFIFVLFYIRIPPGNIICLPSIEHGGTYYKAAVFYMGLQLNVNNGR
jgi:hypothetical protein